MSHNTHSTVGQNAGRVLYAPVQRGISLTEVLIAMGILTVGLLGVAAIFPVASFYMQKGEIADRGSAIAQAAFNDAVSRGVLNPENWLAWEDGSVYANTMPPTVPASPGSAPSTFTRNWTEMIRRQKAAEAGSTAPEREKQRYTALEFGSVFMIDPLGVASLARINDAGMHIAASNLRYMRPAAVFPASSVMSLPTSGYDSWSPWKDLSPTSMGPRWPIRRVSLRQPTVTSALKPLDTNLAERRFSAQDDLALDMPTAGDKPSIQRLQLANLDGGSAVDDPLARQSRGDYSWFVTVSPTTSDARDALATDPSAYSYEVSVVVMYKRPLAVVPPREDQDVLDSAQLLIENERSAQAKIVSTGLSGGEVLLTRIPPSSSSNSVEPTSSPFDTLKVGNWIMLCGPHPNSTDERPMMTARWYRVLAIDKQADGIIGDQVNQRLVSLRGPQWPWQPNTYSGSLNLSDSTQLSNSLYVCIPTGAVAVHSKTIHLEGNSIWAGGARGFSPPTPPDRIGVTYNN